MLPNFVVLPRGQFGEGVRRCGVGADVSGSGRRDDLASELHCVCVSFGSVASGLVVGWWQGSACGSGGRTAASYIGWLSVGCPR